ncbi:hypothetical protein LguiB_006559 [Lonicera macranthoides]
MAIVRAQETSSSTFRYNYQVFLSFRGEDTRKTFTDHLYTVLVQAGLRTFRDDDEIERGMRLKLELCKAIQQSRISIIILSRNYASSKRCLDEVAMILEWSQRSSIGHEVLPVFYDVDPSDLRNQKGSIGESFARYKEELIDTEIDDEKKKEGAEKLQRWKVALEEVANLTGLVLKNQGGGYHVVLKFKGTETIEGLTLDMQMYKDDAFNVKKEVYDGFWDSFFSSYEGNSLGRRYFNFLSSEPLSDVSFSYDDFSRMDKLRILKLNYTNVSGRGENLPKGLKWLCWHGFCLKSLPSDLPLGNLASLDMSYSNLEHVWAANKVLFSLKILNLSHSQRLIKTPNFRGLPNLERLILKGCVSLVEVSDTIGNLGKLTLLNLENCKSLKKFPNIGTLNPLETLVLDGCSSIIESLKVYDNNEVNGLYEFGIFSTFLRQGEIPSWCGDRNDYKRSSSSISFIVPSHPSLRIRGLNLYSTYTLSNSREMGHHSVLFTKIDNKTKDLKWIYSPLHIAVPEKENEEEELVWLSHWKFGNHLVSGDKVDVLVFGGEGLEVKEFGINLVWDEEEEEEEIKANTRDVIGGDLSSYEFMSTRAFFFSNRYIHAFVLPGYTRTSWFREIIKDHVTVEVLSELIALQLWLVMPSDHRR